MNAATFNVMSVKSMVSTWNRKGVMYCDNCRERKRKMVKNMFCSYKYSIYEVIRMKRHDNIVSELYCWVKVRLEKMKLDRLNSFQIWMADNT